MPVLPYNKEKSNLDLVGYESMVLPKGDKVSIKKYSLLLRPWGGAGIEDSYGHKQLIDYKGKPLFAELTVLRMLCRQGWDGVWVDTYRKRFLVDLPENKKQASLPKSADNVLKKITEKNGKFTGCWDIFLWKGNKVKFFELKRKSKDAIRANQIKWLAAAIDIGYSAEQFAIVEWALRTLRER